jgi:hypothetical protein
MTVFCNECGKPVPEGSEFCLNCDSPIQASLQVSQQENTVSCRHQFNWKIGVVIGVVVLLVATGVTLGLVFGLGGGGGGNKEGTYVLKTESGYTSTLVLKSNGVASVDLEALYTKIPSAYVIKGDRIKVWDKSLTSPKDTEAMWFTKEKDGNLIDDQGETWTKQGQ